MIDITSAVYVTEMNANRGIDIDIDSPVTAQKPVQVAIGFCAYERSRDQIPDEPPCVIIW